jgi:hypothetical protein
MLVSISDMAAMATNNKVGIRKFEKALSLTSNPSERVFSAPRSKYEFDNHNKYITKTILRKFKMEKSTFAGHRFHRSENCLFTWLGFMFNPALLRVSALSCPVCSATYTSALICATGLYNASSRGLVYRVFKARTNNP